MSDLKVAGLILLMGTLYILIAAFTGGYSDREEPSIRLFLWPWWWAERLGEWFRTRPKRK